MATERDSAKVRASGLTEVWIGLGFLGLVVIGVVSVFGEQIAGVFSNDPPGAVGTAAGNASPQAPPRAAPATTAAPTK